MRIDVLTLFPEMFDSPLSYSILKRAQESGVVDIALTNIRDFSDDKHKKVDDKPYGGGPGMVMMVEPLRKALADARRAAPEGSKTVYLSPQGKKVDQA